MRTHSLAATLLAIVLAASVAHAAPERFSLETLRRIVGVGSPRVSPDGRTVAFVVTKPNYEKDRNESELWVADLATGAPRALTFERHHVSEPLWSPDGATLSFLAPDDKDHAQIWLLPFRGGESRRFTSSPTGVEHYAWRPDGGAIAFAASDTVAKQLGEAGHLTTFEVGAQDLFLRSRLQPQHIWVQKLADGEARRVTGGVLLVFLLFRECLCA